ncbi:GntR family transcriptional regulator [Rhodoplanes azumiensis]|uniref:GntR family transcriptional regulator n=1 Tax=Rhodoplanes azumiensis TaxID=1897628 RepID=A0ABW5ANJ7_9BRAD
MSIVDLTAARDAGDEAGPRLPAGATVYERLRQMIVTLALPPGAAINRAELQASFGLSSTPVRDALTRLAEEGLVDIKAQSATRVSLIDVAAARQAQFLRRAVEQEAVRLLAALPDKEFEPELRALLDAQTLRAAAGDLDGFDTLDRAFHRRLVELAGAPDLDSLVRSRCGHIDRIRRLHLPVRGKAEEVVRDHARILKAIVAGNAEKAQARVRDHLARSLAYVETLRAAHPGFFRG